jgi:hypothetical protein
MSDNMLENRSSRLGGILLTFIGVIGLGAANIVGRRKSEDSNFSSGGKIGLPNSFPGSSG